VVELPPKRRLFQGITAMEVKHFPHKKETGHIAWDEKQKTSGVKHAKVKKHRDCPYVN